MGIAAKILAVIGALALSGCWISDTPLIKTADADMPKIEGLWASSTGKHYQLTANEASRSFLTKSWTEAEPTPTFETLTFDELGDGWYIGQSVNPAGVRGYEIIRVGKRQVKNYKPLCNAAVTARKDVTKNADGDCEFTSLAGLRSGALTEIARIMADEVSPSAIYYPE